MASMLMIARLSSSTLLIKDNISAKTQKEQSSVLIVTDLTLEAEIWQQLMSNLTAKTIVYQFREG
jgi:hypothetical protein